MELRLTYQLKKVKLLNIKIKKTLPITVKAKVPAFNFSCLSKVFATSIFQFKTNLWLFDSITNLYISNNQSLFFKFVEKTTVLLGVT